MFVSNNGIKAIKALFKQELVDLYTPSEIELILKEFVCKRLNINRSEYILLKDNVFSESDLLYLNSVLKRLKKEEPFQHVLGETEFFGITVKCDSRALIPRPETEELVDWIATDGINTDAQIMDLCSGSGCIALAIKSLRDAARVVASELSDDAIELIEENKKLTKIDIEVVKLDVLNNASYNFYNNEFDIWVANPPYIPHKDKVIMDNNVLNYEPGLALFVANDDPIVFYRLIAENGLKYLKSGGRLYFEMHEDYAKEVKETLKGLGYQNVEVKQDLQGKDRMIKAEKQ